MQVRTTHRAKYAISQALQGSQEVDVSDDHRDCIRHLGALAERRHGIDLGYHPGKLGDRLRVGLAERAVPENLLHERRT